MANTSRTGFFPIGRRGGGEWSVREYYMPSTDATNAFIGDIMKSAGSSDDNGERITVTSITATSDIAIGVLVGIKKTSPDDLTTLYRKAGTATVVFVCDDPDVLLETQADDATALSAADVGLVGLPVVGSGSTATGFSGHELDESSLTTTNTYMLRLERVIARPGNEIGADAKVVVSFNVHQYGVDTGATGR